MIYSSLDDPKLEEKVERAARAALARSDTTELAGRISGLLLADREAGQEAGQRQASRQAGLLVDWLELLDPTVISACPDLQMQLVFGRAVRGEAGQGAGPACRPYLLSLLTHQAR